MSTYKLFQKSVIERIFTRSLAIAEGPRDALC